VYQEEDKRGRDARFGRTPRFGRRGQCPGENDQSYRKKREEEIQPSKGKRRLHPKDEEDARREKPIYSSAPACEDAQHEREGGEDEDLLNCHLEALINPYRRGVGHSKKYRDDNEKEQQRETIFARGKEFFH